MTIMLANDCAKLSQFTNLMSLLYLCYVCHYYGLAIIILYFLTLLLICFILRWPYSQVMQALNPLDCWSQAKVISECFSLQTHHIDIINSNNLIPYISQHCPANLVIHKHSTIVLNINICAEHSHRDHGKAATLRPGARFDFCGFLQFKST